MHIVIKHIVSNIGISLFLLFSILLGFNAYAEQSAEETIKARKALFSKNYRTAKKVQSLSASGEFDEAKKLMIEMSDNYKILIKLFPDNTKEGFKTEALPSIWENKKEFNDLMKKSSDDMIKLASLFEDADDVRAILTQMMWSNCKACHSKFRAPH